MKNWIEKAHRKTKSLSFLINNAIFVHWKDYQGRSVEEEELSMKPGYHALVYTTKKALPIMQKQQSGHNINIGSSAGSILVPGCSAAYTASKAASNYYTLFLQQELKSKNIYVILVRPITVSATDFF